MEHKVEKYDISKPYFRYDWLHGTVHGCFCIQDFLSGLSELDPKLSSNNFIKMDCGLYNYTSRLGLFGKGTIQICWIQDKLKIDGDYAVRDGCNPGIFFVVSGDGIRYLGADLFIKLCFYLHSLQFKCSRIDVCCDLYDPDNPFVPLYCTALENCFTYNYSSGSPVAVTHGAKLNRFSYYDRRRKILGFNYWLGRKASEWGMLRIYDKYFECYEKHPKIADELVARCPAEYWFRFEFELHKSNANCIFLNIINGCFDPSIGFLKSIEHFRIGLGNNFQSRGKHPVYEQFFAFLEHYSDKRLILYNSGTWDTDKFVDYELDNKIDYFCKMSPILALFSIYCQLNNDFFFKRY